MTILYAEDDNEDFDFFSEMLTIVNPEAVCHRAKDGADALEILGSLMIIPDYIFLDINMPLMDGKACLKEIKKDTRFKDVPVAIYTTTNDPKEKLRCLNAGATAFLLKPSTIETGIISLSKYFEKKGDM